MLSKYKKAYHEPESSLCSLFFVLALHSWLRWLYTKMKRMYNVRCTMYNFRSRLPLFAPPLPAPSTLIPPV